MMLRLYSCVYVHMLWLAWISVVVLNSNCRQGMAVEGYLVSTRTTVSRNICKNNGNMCSRAIVDKSRVSTFTRLSAISTARSEAETVYNSETDSDASPHHKKDFVLHLKSQDGKHMTLILYQYLDTKEQLQHFEFYRIQQFRVKVLVAVQKWWWYLYCQLLPRKLRKPVMKVGVKTLNIPATGLLQGRLEGLFPSSTPRRRSEAVQQSPILANTTDTTSMKTSFSSQYDQSLKKYSIGLFVYMFVHEQFRGSKNWNLGDFLLDIGKQYCRQKGNDFMLLVHDDQGSGKLIKYYEQRQFMLINDLVPKGMVCRL